MSLYNLRRVATATVGTGTITLGATVTGFKAFTDAPAIPDGTVVTYALADMANSEIGWGLYSASGPTLTRNVIESTNSNTPISLSGNAQVFITSSAGDLQSNTAFPNRIRNGGMDVWQRGTGSITATTAGAYTADGWIVLPTGASVTAAQAAGRLLTSYSLQITGAASVTDLIIKQRTESNTSAAMTSQQVTFQAWVFNNTGGSITPTLTVKIPTAPDNYTATSTNVSAVSLQPCANSAWTQISYTFAASASSANGTEVAIDFGNNFSSGAKTIQITECDLRVTPGVPSGINYAPPEPQFRPIHEELLFCQRYYFDPANGGSSTIFQVTANALSSGVLVSGMIFYTGPMRITPSATPRNQAYTNASALSLTPTTIGAQTSFTLTSATSPGSVLFNAAFSAEL